MRWVAHAFKWLSRSASSTAFWQYVAPTTTALYVNKRYVVDPATPSGLPDASWVHAQVHGLLARSEDRLRSIEAKGPGLAAVSAIIAAAVLVALSNGWGRSDDLGRALLVVAAIYSIFSLITPIYLVGPQRRAQLWTGDLEDASREKSPEDWLAKREAEAAMSNAGKVIKLSNLQAAARNDLVWSVAALLLWVLLVPASGVLRHHHEARPGCGTSVPSACCGRSGASIRLRAQTAHDAVGRS